MLLKRCSRCRRWQPQEDFHRNRAQADGLQNQCKACRRESQPEYKRKWRYGLNPGEFESMLTSQGGTCAVCRRRPGVQVDHDHATGRFRGILCDGCNGGLSAFYEREDLLITAIEYLEKWC